MTMKRSVLSMIGLSAALTMGAFLSAGAGEPAAAAAAAKIGAAAPAFTLKDPTGKEYKLADFAGKIVVLEWINPDCPYCVRVYKDGLIAKTIKEIKAIDKDVVYVGINSTNYMGPDKTAAFAKEHKLDFPTLVDQDGTAGHTYDARTTPHLFVIDAKGVLRYQGALDDDKFGKKAEKSEPVTNYVVNAVKQIKAGETVSPDQTQPYGCNVKYKN